MILKLCYAWAPVFFPFSFLLSSLQLILKSFFFLFFFYIFFLHEHIHLGIRDTPGMDGLVDFQNFIVNCGVNALIW